MVARTIRSVFRTVDLYTEDISKIDKPLNESFYNMVFYASDGLDRIKFREPSSDDLIFDGIYRNVLEKFPRYRTELPDDQYTCSGGCKADSIVTDDSNPLEKLQEPTTILFWKYLRELFDKEFWLELF